ncbi:T9SS type A sorting domain-containing protein [Dyadobacter helix]|nr:T9SS type A sorting domain-containing protein [Dyadobacter sp. CECT 9275]
MQQKSSLKKVSFIFPSLVRQFLFPLFFFICCHNSHAQREIILNTTGYGFDRNTTNGIADNQWTYIQKFANLTHTPSGGSQMSASPTAVRLHIEWNHYEPTAGNYQGDKLKAAIKAIVDLNMKVALHFSYLRPGSWNDTYFSSPDISRIQDSTLVQTNIAHTCPSLYSDAANTKFLAYVDHALSQLSDYYSKILYVEVGNNPTEEYYVPSLSKNDVTYIGMYDYKARMAWRNDFLTRRYPGANTITWGRNTYNRTEAPQPADVDWNSEIGRDFHRFAAWGLLNLYKKFYQTVKARSSSIKVLFFASDFGGQQGNIRHLHNSSLPLALDLGDGIYTSDGTNDSDLWRKISGIDCIKGSNINKIAAVEFDPEDLGQPSGGSGIWGGLATSWFERAFVHGADYVHIAMHFYDNEIAQLAEGIALNKQKYINTAYTPPTRSAPVSINIFPNVFTGNALFDQWQTLGGRDWATADAKPISIKMQDDGYWESIWSTSNYLPCTFSLSASPSNSSVRPGESVTLNTTCSGAECDRALYTWSGNGVNNVSGNSISITAPQTEGSYTYTMLVKRSGCMNKTVTTSFAVNTALPVTLIDFKARPEGKTAVLSWQTSSETNSDRFEVQRSNDGKHWTTIGTVMAQGDVKDAISTYGLTDASPANGNNLYRLKMIDRDNTFGYSRIVNVTFDKEKLSVYPNPVSKTLTFSSNETEPVEKVQILNTNGQVMYQSDSTPNPEINVENLSTGTYLLKLIFTNGTEESSKFIKSK